MENRRVRTATPWIKTECGGTPETIDLEFEKFNIEQRNTPHHSIKYKKYVEFVKKFFHTDDPKQLVFKGWHSDVLPVFCERTDSIELVDSKTGETIKRIATATELIRVARLIVRG